MKTDSIFYRLFQTFPGCLFELLNLPADIARDYRFTSLEVKQLAFRIDGVFLSGSEALRQADRPEDPMYFVEVQFQRDRKFYSRFFSEIFLYLHQSDRENNWRGVVIYPRREIDGGDRERYTELLNSGRVSRFYLNELSGIDSVRINTLRSIIAADNETMDAGNALLQQVRREYTEPRQRRELLELIETILIYKLPRVSRKEIEAMFSVSDLKQTKVYQEALEEGIERGIERGRQEGELAAKVASVSRLAALGLNAEQIAGALVLDIERVRQILEAGEE